MRMGKDAELNRLGDSKDKAYAKLKEVREEKNRLSKECSRLHDALDDAYKAQNRAYEAQKSEWEAHKRSMQDYSDKIEAYRRESDRYHAEMVSYFQKASDAHNAHDGAGAKSWSNAGHNSKALMRDAKEQIGYWVRQSQESKSRFENSSTKKDFENAKRRTEKLKTEFAEVSAKYKPVKALCEQLQTAFNEAKKAFDDRLNFLKSEASNKKRIVEEKGTIYARFRSRHSPISLPSKVFYDRNNPNGPFHLTMKYNDGYRISWDATPTGDSHYHWTNENVPKKVNSDTLPQKTQLLAEAKKDGKKPSFIMTGLDLHQPC